jgi:hypothetical protein
MVGLAQEPRRLWKRYLVGNCRFIWLVLASALPGRAEQSEKLAVRPSGLGPTEGG